MSKDLSSKQLKIDFNSEKFYKYIFQKDFGVRLGICYKEPVVKNPLTNKEIKNIEGRTDCSNWDKKYTYIDVLINNAIRSAAREAIKEFMEQETKTFKKAFRNYLKQKQTLDKLFDSFVNFADKTMVENNYKMDIRFEWFSKM